MHSWRALTTLLGAVLLAGSLGFVLAPMLADFSTYGFHDWDAATAFRYITVLSAKQGEGPWWHPWLCGGVPAFGYPEGAPNLVSPYLPIYLAFDLRTAVRLEVLGQGLFGLLGAYAFASTLTRSVALRLLLPALFVLNGRWALQAATGHTWHLQYAFVPWVFYAFERSLVPGKQRYACLAGGALALCAYHGGIYPLPHATLLLILYACLRSAFERSTRPLSSLAIAGASAIGLAAPKLFAVADQMRVIPRLIESTEVIGFVQLFAMLTAPDQRYGVHSAPVPAYNWHEWGIYIGFGGVAVLLLALLSEGARGKSYKILGLLCLLLGFGAYAQWAPWSLLHELPLFASQHVPSRFHYPMLLMLGASFLVFAGRYVDPMVLRRPWLDTLLLLPVAAIAWDMARFSQTPFAQAFWMQAPTIEPAPTFEHRRNAPVRYVKQDWAQPILLSMFANSGVERCYGVDPNFEPSVVPVEDPAYVGPVSVEGVGTARVLRFTPNHALVEVSGARAGDVVVYNMNHDASWRANGEPALAVRGLVAARVAAGTTQVSFRYFPRTLAASVPLCLLTLLACLWRPGGAARLGPAWERLRRRFADRKPPREA
jgi:hypothetical protein